MPPPPPPREDQRATLWTARRGCGPPQPSGVEVDHDGPVLTPDLSATVAGAHLVLARRDGVEHSTFPVADLDAVEHLDILAAGGAPPIRA